MTPKGLACIMKQPVSKENSLSEQSTNKGQARNETGLNGETDVTILATPSGGGTR